ncbi:transcription-repair coupling factor [Blastopirellula retiformator]|uniref:Transcription-repair-coupling factor n=1 Tax=Blastopirellula retiformator TaxID=2527970 RepID=A0A5C5V6G2_9BACT|nr:transcription-repair coupling factor [Blastopirellula retiformator]TWT33397.1 Transcription-repair-coupling factor [Blastopirellula retiformator]
MATGTTLESAAAQLRSLPQGLAERTEFRELVTQVAAGRKGTIEGVWGSACALVAAAAQIDAAGPMLVVCPTLANIDDVYDALRTFTEASVVQFPAWESDRSERLLHDEIYGRRLRVLKQLTHGPPPKFIVTSIESLLQPVPSAANVSANSRRVVAGDQLDLEELAQWLVRHKFHSTSAVELPGEFSLRGGILDVFAPDWEQPARIELFGDEVESIRQFEIETQRSLHPLDSAEITVLRYGKGQTGHFSDYLPSASVCVLIELERIKESAEQYLDRLERVEDKFGLPETMQKLQPLGTLSLSSVASGHLDASLTLHFESVEQFSGEIERVRGELEALSTGQDVYIICQTEAEIERLQEIFQGGELQQSGRLHFSLGRMPQGFRYREESVVLVSGDQLFHRVRRQRPATRKLGKVIDSFLDLRSGDLVVHLAHGIGRYRGLKMIEKQRQVEEHLEIEFHGGTKVYVPASKVDLVQKYVGGSKTRPPLAKIGGVTWQKQKKAVEQAVHDLAGELLEVQAMRRSRPGIAFSADTLWQREFDLSFPYEETEDQLAAIGNIKFDMEQPRPMDRLLCGDVGFGKTEVAMRGAFKAVDNGYQVAILVPTTILAEQHYKSLRQRMAEFPFTIARLSRFASAAEQRDVVRGLKEGSVDIVVGTHRLASKDVRFQNLGLVIIDEEQRFGVEIKEKLKQLRTTVDVLTMTATPIPRTLHMSLVGVRDISNLETAPQDRVAVETKVSRWGDELIRHAVLRELSRGGQVYFVHNRVQDIQLVAAKLKRIVPEAKIGIGHGQMPEGALEQVMVDFVEGKFDLLLATTIVESGLDIPNANTIFVDEADRYGLADLHQLRGRVGRYKHRAYCYLLLQPGRHLSPVAAKRLHAIEEFSHMGAGFAISMRDLEIRGAGNILGTQQSGHIAMVGYELYCQLLEKAVRRMKRMPPQISIDVDVDLPGSAFLPDTYISDMRQKIDLYRRMTRVASDTDIANLKEEMLDRFGPFPDPVERMLRLTEIKLDAAFWQINAIFLEDDYLVFQYSDRGRVEQLAKLHGRNFRIVDDKSVYVPLKTSDADADAIINTAKSILQPS